MSVILSQFGKKIGRLMRQAPMTTVCNYHRTSRPRRREQKKKVTAADFDDGYYYRSGEVHYAQALRNKQEETLRFDNFLEQFTKKYRGGHTRNVTIEFPNCTCNDQMREYRKRRQSGNVPETAVALHEYSTKYFDL